MKSLGRKIASTVMALGLLSGASLAAAPAAMAAVPNNGPGYTQYWVYYDWCPAGQPYIHRDWYIKTDYNAWYETLYGKKDYIRYDHTDYRVAMYVYNCR